MSANHLHTAQAKYRELTQNRLKPYQVKSVEAICAHFQSVQGIWQALLADEAGLNNAETPKGVQRALLADEVGLGKTEITKGVIANLAMQHWQQANQDRPFRVAYLCPNLDVSTQNFPKLNLFPAAANTTQNPAIVSLLKDTLKNYRNEKGINASSQRTFLQKDSVYTRVCSWLIRYYEGSPPADILTEEEAFGYLRGNHNPDWAKSATSPQCKPPVQTRAKELMKAIKTAISSDKTLFSYWQEWLPEETLSKEGAALVSAIYTFNKKMAVLLSAGNQVKDDYRLSLQHLFAAEAAAKSQSQVMQLEALTPSTSLKIDNQSGTKEERALLAATIKAMYPPASCDTATALLRSKEFDEDLFTVYCKRLSSLPPDQTAQLKNWLPEDAQLKAASSISAIRRCFIESNLKHLEYDLVIMDEFQNFAELIHAPDSDAKEHLKEAYALAETLLNKSNTRVLMLSATPFRIADLALSSPEVSSLDSRAFTTTLDGIYEDFFSLARFMMIHKSDDDFETWKTKWKKNRGMEDAAQREACRALLMDEAGIFRTERIAAAKRSPILTIDHRELSPNFLYPMLVQADMLSNQQKSDDEDSRAAAMNGVKATPYAYTFSPGYQLAFFAEKSTRHELFLTREDLFGAFPTFNLTQWPQFLALKKDLMTGFKGKTKKAAPPSAAGMLWIPPCNPSKPLKGAFAGHKGFSKTLIFTSNRMTPKAFMYLLCREAELLLAPADIGSYTNEAVREVLRGMMKNLPAYPKLKNAFLNYFEELFLSPHGVAAVRLQYPLPQHEHYPAAMEKYCEDGCFEDMLREYTALLEQEYDKKDSFMAAAIRKIGRLPLSRCSLYLSDGNKVRLQSVETPNKYAVALFSQTPQKQNKEKATAQTNTSDSKDYIPRMSNLKAAFNSPFWPFVLTTTSIGTEGIDLHWYARNVVHWTVPERPIDLEQREGRVLRFNCHAYRLNQALIREREDDGILSAKEDEKDSAKTLSVKEEWKDSGLFDCQLNFFSDEECDGDERGCYHVRRLVYFSPHTEQHQRYEHCIRVVKHYRNMIGQEVTELPASNTTPQTEPLCLSPWLLKDSP